MSRKISRRDFFKKAGIGAAGLALGPSLMRDVFAQQPGRRTLRVFQWSHFVPTHDKWFDQYAKQWGEKNNVDVTIDHIGLPDLRSTFARGGGEFWSDGHYVGTVGDHGDWGSVESYIVSKVNRGKS